MAITISSFTTSSSPAASAQAANTVRSAEQKESKEAEAQVDKVSLGAGTRSESLTYANPRASTSTPAQSSADLQAMLEESDRQAQEMIDLIMAMVNRQGTTLEKIISGEQVLDADPATIAAAQEAVAEDGEWGVQKTAERILDFSKSVIGDDPSKLETIRAAVERGFKEATAILGGKLPEISEKTYAVVMAEFDRWRNEGLSSPAVDATGKQTPAAES